MFRSRMLIALGVCFLAASGAWADEVGYVDCSSHSEGTQVFAKPRKTPDIVAPLACGERFTVLVYGFYFSRIQTKDGQVGYIYSNLITVDNGAPRTQQVAPQTPSAPAARPAVEPVPSFQTAAEKTKIPRTPPIDAEPGTAAPATTQPEAVAAQPAVAQPEATPPVAPAQNVTTQTGSAPTAGTSTASSAPASASVTETAAASDATSAEASSPTNAVPATTPTAAQPDTAAPIQPPGDAVPANAAQPNVGAAAAADTPSASTKQPDLAAAENASPAPAQPDATVAQLAANTAAQPAAGQPTSSATSTQPEPAAAQPEPAPAQPVPAQPAPTPAIKPGDRTETWEKPNPSARTAPLVELFGGYAFTRVGGASNGTNLNGALGSFGWNPTSWLQVVADTSYSEQTIGTTKNVLYGNHFGPRFFRRTRFRWGITPFAEAFVGGSSEKTTISGSGGSTSSTGSAISYKIGGGIDIHPSRHWDVRLFDFDYYRTSFGPGAQQNNYWISSGVVLRLFGGRDE